MGDLAGIGLRAQKAKRGSERALRGPAVDLTRLGSFVQGGWLPLEKLPVNDYDPIAAVFDAVMANDFHSVTHHLRRDVAVSLKRGGPLRCLDLCCGTGLFFELLGTDLPIVGHGIDRSSREIAVAQARKFSPSSSLEFGIADIVHADYPEDVDLITINFDALNHIKGVPLWREILRKCLRSLVPGGALLFDVNLPERLRNDWDYPEVIVKDHLCYIQIGFPPKWRGHTVARKIGMLVFMEQAGGGFARAGVLVEQFAMPLQDVLALTESVGFRRAEVLAATSNDPVGHIFNKNRAFILARK